MRAAVLSRPYKSLSCSITNYNNRLIWTFFCCLQTFLFQVLGNFVSGHVCFLAALVETENFRTYDDTAAGDVTSVWINCCLHQTSLASGKYGWDSTTKVRQQRSCHEIRNSKSEARNKSEFQILQCSKQKRINLRFLGFGHLKLRTRPQGGESGGPILKICICFEFRYSDFSILCYL